MTRDTNIASRNRSAILPFSGEAGSPKERTMEDVAARLGATARGGQWATVSKGQIAVVVAIVCVSCSIESNPRVFSQPRSRACHWSRVTNQISIKLRNAFRGEHAGEGRQPFATFTGSFSCTDLSAPQTLSLILSLDACECVCTSLSRCNAINAGPDGLCGGFTRLLLRTLKTAILQLEYFISNVTVWKIRGEK